MAEGRDEGQDEELTRVVVPGLDATYLAQLYVEYGPELRRFILGVVRDPEVASDVLQATFAKAIELGHTAREETVRGWLFRVALNEALATRRRRATREGANRKLAWWGAGQGGERPEESLIRGETVEAVRRTLSKLPEAEREVVRARVYEGKTFARIAEDQGVPLGTVLTRMRRALEKLRRGPETGEGAR